MSTELMLRNSQRTLRLNLKLLREVTRHLLEQELGLQDYELGVHFVSERRMAEVNRQFLQHEGATDVITFNYRASAGDVDFYSQPRSSRRQEAQTKSGVGDWSLLTSAATVHGELFICPAIARKQARAFRKRWQEEIIRYLVHGVLHLRGFDDLDPARRRVMKREENRLLRRLARRFTLRKTGGSPRVRA